MSCQGIRRAAWQAKPGSDWLEIGALQKQWCFIHVPSVHPLLLAGTQHPHMCLNKRQLSFIFKKRIVTQCGGWPNMQPVFALKCFPSLYAESALSCVVIFSHLSVLLSSL